LTRATGDTTLERSIAKLRELAETVSAFYQSQVQEYASAENLSKLSATKNQFD